MYKLRNSSNFDKFCFGRRAQAFKRITKGHVCSTELIALALPEHPNKLVYITQEIIG